MDEAAEGENPDLMCVHPAERTTSMVRVRQARLAYRLQHVLTVRKAQRAAAWWREETMGRAREAATRREDAESAGEQESAAG